MSNWSKEEVKEFLDGSNPLKYVVAVEPIYQEAKCKVFIHKPDNSKSNLKISYTPFLYIRDLKDLNFYRNDNVAKINAMSKHGITIKKLKTFNNPLKKHIRNEMGYKFLVETPKSHTSLINFFKEGGIDPYGDDYKKYFVIPSVQEQFFISTGIRLFKGYEFYDNIHRGFFDIETTGLESESSRCFLIGFKDNKGFQKVYAPEIQHDDESEKNMIIEFLGEVIDLNPSVVSGYNSENFDFYFLLKRLEILGVDLKDLQTPNGNYFNIRRKDARIKLGNDTEFYEQTLIHGMSVIDILHAARRAKAINSDIENTKLKYMTKFLKKNKPNRMYVDGDKIAKIYFENKDYVIDTKNKYELLSEKNKHLLEEDDYKLITGVDIVTQYLIDDLEETQAVDEELNQATYLFSKYIPSTFSRAATMGGAGPWNLLMITWSYMRGNCIPLPDTKREFTGGLSRIFRVGYDVNILKADFGALYPSEQLDWDIFPSVDFDNILKGFLFYFLSTRNEFKALSKDKTLSDSERQFYGTKQLPLKIFNNSNFGANGSEYFNWAEFDCAERITCTGRQYLRNLSDYLMNFGCKLVVCDTDGMNVSVPDFSLCDMDLNPIDYKLKVEDLEYKGRKSIDAIFEKYNKEYLTTGFMICDNDGQWKSSTNFAKKNYANLEFSGKVKLTGNSLKSSSHSKLIKTFLYDGIKMILENKPEDFVEYYYETLSKIYHQDIILSEIASKAKVKETKVDYCRTIVLPDLIKRLIYIPVTLFENEEKITDELINNKILKKCDKTKFLNLNIDYYINKINFIKKNDILKKEKSNIPPYVYNLIEEILENFENMEWVENILIPYIKEKGSNFKNFSSKPKEPKYSEYRELFDEYFFIYGNKNGQVKAKKAHMELLIDKDLHIDLGEVIYYINIGKAKSHGDTSFSNKDGKLYCELINEEDLGKKGTYNYKKYVDQFNSATKTLLTVFKDDVATSILKDDPSKREYYTQSQLEMVARPKDDVDKDFFCMEEKEINFWNKTLHNPYEIYDKFLLPENKKLIYKDYIKTYEKLKKIFAEKNITILKKTDDLLENQLYLDYNTKDDTFLVIRHHYKKPKILKVISSEINR